MGRNGPKRGRKGRIFAACYTRPKRLSPGQLEVRMTVRSSLRRCVALGLVTTAWVLAPASQTLAAGGEPVTPAQTAALTTTGALSLAMKHSPGLRIAVLELRQATLAVDKEDARYVASFSASLGYTQTASPSLRVNGTEVGRRDGVAIARGLSHQFSFGTVLGADLELDGAGTRLVDPSDPTLNLGPGYGVLIRLSATQPLLRGLGNDSGLAALVQARLARDAATQAKQRAASELARDVIGAYWELWYAQAAERIQADAVVIAKRQLTEAVARAEAGRIPDLDVLPLRTAVGTAEERSVSAQVASRKVRCRSRAS